MISWIGTVCSVVGSFVVAFQILVLGYTLFLIGSLSWLYVGIVKRDKPLIVLNGVFFLANVIGLTRAVI